MLTRLAYPPERWAGFFTPQNPRCFLIIQFFGWALARPIFTTQKKIPAYGSEARRGFLKTKYVMSAKLKQIGQYGNSVANIPTSRLVYLLTKKLENIQVQIDCLEAYNSLLGKEDDRIVAAMLHRQFLSIYENTDCILRAIPNRTQEIMILMNNMED